MVQIDDLKREFIMGDETVRALQGISFDVEEGEFLTIMGSSGSGKTTLLNILGCLDKPSGGTYFLDGINVRLLNRNELSVIRNKKIGFIFQAYNLLPRTNALENVQLPLYYNAAVSARARKERAEKALQAVKLESRMYHYPNQLSGGQQQRVAIARALVNDPIVILADEATGNLDTRTSYEIMALLQELNHQGKTIIFVTHEQDIAAFSRRTIMLRDGQILKDVMNQQVRSAKDMLTAMPVTNEY
ncbi:ABC transporter ATP-binding protein [Chitinophagaceae bacterium LB-8]|uniref:ABC transporter ATP-binding protein n=1 Tax=Paraflavisolibacter caeni TaxID=2982496 RepID=A0A9X2XZG7_9BACT|nr:ABC transporter ATP-binding protein [Paraflavisolibacter caeni]